MADEISSAEEYFAAFTREELMQEILTRDMVIAKLVHKHCGGTTTLSMPDDYPTHNEFVTLSWEVSKDQKSVTIDLLAKTN